MNSSAVVVLNFESAQDLVCSYCQQEFKTNENRRYQILLEKNNNKITTLSAIHVNICLPRAEEEAAMAKIEAVHLPPRHWVKSFQELEVKFPFIAKLVDAYEGEVAIYTSTGTGYVIEFPISLGNVPIVKDLFKFPQFKAFFTSVEIKEITLEGVRALDYPTHLKKVLQMLPPICTIFVWIHQVTGTNNCFRVILAIQANESDLVSVYQSSLFQVWTNTVIDPKNYHVQKLTQPVTNILTQFEEKLELTAKALQLKPMIKSVKSLDVSHTSHFNGVYHHEYNVQQCKGGGEMYVLPRLENVVSDSKTPVLCFSGESSEFLPIFYDTTITTTTDIEKELSQAKLTKQPLTNYQSLLALFPQAINRPV
jgi:hypothetical protein